MYPFPAWRRVAFVAVLVIVLVIAFAPSLTQGSTTIRLATFSAPSSVSHLYVEVSSVQLHRLGFPFSLNNSWTSLSQTFPKVDLLSQSSQNLPPTVASANVPSGSYDALKISFTNSTVTIAGQAKALAAPQALLANVTLPVPPNGIGNVLIVVTFDYATLFASQPTISFILVRTTSV